MTWEGISFCMGTWDGASTLGVVIQTLSSLLQAQAGYGLSRKQHSQRVKLWEESKALSLCLPWAQEEEPPPCSPASTVSATRLENPHGFEAEAGWVKFHHY